MRIACLGGGPAGLCFAISMRLRRPDPDIAAFERDKPDDAFGWGVLLSDQTLDNLAANDPESANAIRARFACWDDIAVHRRGERVVATGHGFCAIGGKRLLILLQERARPLGVDLRFETELDGASDVMRGFDRVLDWDGLDSKARKQFENVFKPDIHRRACRFVSPRRPGLDASEHKAAWRRVADVVHAETDAKIRRQIGHAGRKGSTQLGGRGWTRRSRRGTGRWSPPRRSRGRSGTRSRGSWTGRGWTKSATSPWLRPRRRSARAST